MASADNNGRRSSVFMILTRLLSWIVPGFGFILVIGLVVSPWFGEHLDLVFEDIVRAPATIQSCHLVRDGERREHAVRCAYSYVYQGKTYVLSGPAWTSDSPLETLVGLHQTLAQQATNPVRQVDVRTRNPEDARLVDDRWLVMPALWALLLVLLAGLISLGIYFEPSTRIYRRADLIRNPLTDPLVEINGERAKRRKRLSMLWIFTVLIAMLGCTYGLSNRVSNDVSKLGFLGLHATPARLIGCRHRFHGLSKGHDQIDCGFLYQWNGHVLRGEADSLNFRLVATDARMDAEARADEGKQVTAYVDAGGPSYAWAFIHDEWLVLYSWGILELILCALLLVILPIGLIQFIRGAFCSRGAD